MPAPADFEVLAAQDTPDGARSLVRFNGLDTPVSLPGRFVEAQFPLSGGERLVFLTHGILQEEQLEICLLDGTRVTERVSLSFMGGADDVTAITRRDPTHFTFNFPSDHARTLSLTNTPAWTLPQPGIHRYGRWRGRMRLG